jgi:hypothetical protein
MSELLKHLSWRTGQATTLAGVLLTFAQLAVRQGLSGPFTSIMNDVFHGATAWSTILVLVGVSAVLLYAGYSGRPGQSGGDRRPVSVHASRTAR